MARALGALAGLAAALLLGACETTGALNGGLPKHHFSRWQVDAPRGRTVHVCHAYGCNRKTAFTFSDADIAAIKTLMAETKKADTAAEERRAIAYAIAWMETRTGKRTGAAADRPGMDFEAAGDPTQQDCVDEATNTTSYLSVLINEGLITHHRLGTPFTKGNILLGIKYWPHYTAIIYDNATNVAWAVDSWIFANGENPAVVEKEHWYTTDLDNLPASLI